MEKSKFNYDKIESRLNELEAIYESAPIIMFLLDKDRRVVRSNLHTSRVTGLSPEEIKGLRGGELLGCVHVEDSVDGCGFGPFCEDCKAKNTVLETFEKGKSIYKRETSIKVNHNGKETLIHLLLSTAKVDVGSESLVLVSVEDITDLKNKEEKLKESNTLLEQQVLERTQKLADANLMLANNLRKLEIAELEVKNSLQKEIALSESRKKFFNLSSHQLRSPLTTILSSAELLQLISKKNSAPEKVRNHIKRILHSAEELNHLINNVSYLSKLESFVPDKKENISVEKLIELINSHKLEKGIEISLINNSGIKEIKVNIDLLKAVLYPLIDNAAMYVQNQPVKVFLKDSDGKFEIKIEDNGAGMNEEELENIFDPFYKSINNQNKSGSGLGLSIAKKASDLLNGTLNVESELGKGAVFTLTLPV